MLGADELQIKGILEEAKPSGIVQIANDNAPGQIVISGASTAVDAAIEIAKATGLRRVIKLPVSAPFHCDLMSNATKVMTKEINKLEFKNSNNKLISNVTAQKITNIVDLKNLLIKQIENRVRWRESVLNMIKNDIN